MPTLKNYEQLLLYDNVS